MVAGANSLIRMHLIDELLPDPFASKSVRTWLHWEKIGIQKCALWVRNQEIHITAGGTKSQNKHLHNVTFALIFSTRRHVQHNNTNDMRCDKSSSANQRRNISLRLIRAIAMLNSWNTNVRLMNVSFTASTIKIESPLRRRIQKWLLHFASIVLHWFLSSSKAFSIIWFDASSSHSYSSHSSGSSSNSLFLWFKLKHAKSH